MAKAETDALWDCFRRVGTPLLDAKVTPERYKLAMDGACLNEERATLDAAEAYLSAMDEGHADVTRRTMEKVRAFHREQRARIVSDYVVLYETRFARAAK